MSRRLAAGWSRSRFQSLSGVSADVGVRWGKIRFREAALFTHRGLSGPAMLQISSYWQHRTPIQVDFLPDRGADWLLEEKRARPRTQVRKLLGQDQLSKLPNAIEASTEEGMQSFDQGLLHLVNEGAITEEIAMERATNPEGLKMNLKGIFLNTDNAIIES